MAAFLIAPGWGSSGPSHWQSHWERDLPRARRVEMQDWLHPYRRGWIDALAHALAAFDEPPVVIAHSLGAVALVHLAAERDLAIRGALLVAPADVERPRFEHLADFAPLPRTRLPFPSRVVASDDDPYATIERSRELAAAWGSELTVLHAAGHINRDSGFGPWRDGLPLARALARPPGRRGYDDEADDPSWIVRATD